MKLSFEWEANKAKENLKKHKISFEEAKTIFNDPFLLTFSDDYHSDREERFISIGESVSNRILLVVHTEHEPKEGVTVIRIISCRKVTALEWRTYEEGEE